MEYRELGRTGVKVSALCLGTMTFGEQNSEAEGHAQLDYAAEQGINFLDASEIYPIPPKPETQGRTEAIIGTWLASRDNRDKTIVATKVAGRTKMNWLRKDGADGRGRAPSRSRGGRGQPRPAQRPTISTSTSFTGPTGRCASSRASTIGISEATAIPFTRSSGRWASSSLTGKVRFVGLSNETPWGVMTFLKASEQHGLPRIVSIQNAYNLVNRSYEIGAFGDHLSRAGEPSRLLAARPGLSLRQI